MIVENLLGDVDIILKNLKHFKKTEIAITIGKTFILQIDPSQKDNLDAGAREIRQRLASQLPEHYLGPYQKRTPKMMVTGLDKTQVRTPKYNHTQHEPMRRFLRFLLKWIGFTLLAKINKVEGVENVPQAGPAILMINHIALIDPILVMHLVPRNIVPMAKIEVYDYPIIGILPKMWGVIPVRREEVDRRAIQQTLQVIEAGEIVLLAPEATRSPQLKQGKEGVAYIASRTQTPVIPVAISGTTGFPTLPFTKNWRQPGAVVKFGRPFIYRKDLKRASREQLRKMMDEAMYVLAGLLPAEQRGVYQDLEQATQDTIEWL